MMKKNKINYIIAFVFVLVLSISNVFAAEIYDTKTVENVYKLSEDDSTFTIPFFRLAQERIELDKSIDQVGMFMTNSTIDVNAEQKGIQVLYTNDTVRVNNPMEYAAIFTSGSVVLNADIEKTVFIYCNGTVTVSDKANIKGNIIAYTPNLVVDGVVEGNILGTAQTVTINNTVNGKIKMEVYDLKLGEEATIAQEMELNTINTALTVDANKASAKIDVIEQTSFSFKAFILEVLQATISGIIMYLLLRIVVKKDKIKAVLQRAENGNVIMNGLRGLVGLLMGLSLGIVFTIAVLELGIAAITFSVALMIIFALLKNLVVGLFIIELSDKKYKDAEVKPSKWLLVPCTFFILNLLEKIPFMGGIVSIFVFILALGMVIAIIKNEKKEDVVKVEVVDQETIQAK